MIDCWAECAPTRESGFGLPKGMCCEDGRQLQPFPLRLDLKLLVI